LTTNRTTAARPPTARPLREICEGARSANCGYCWALPGDECIYTTAPASVPVTNDTPMHPVHGYHVARFGRAFRRGLITGPELITVLQTVGAFTESTVVWDTAADAGRDGSPDDADDQSCPRCAAVTRGSTPDGRLECTRCLWQEPGNPGRDGGAQ
jgi:hypothetical protein